MLVFSVILYKQPCDAGEVEFALSGGEKSFRSQLDRLHAIGWIDWEKGTSGRHLYSVTDKALKYFGKDRLSILADLEKRQKGGDASPLV